MLLSEPEPLVSPFTYGENREQDYHLRRCCRNARRFDTADAQKTAVEAFAALTPAQRDISAQAGKHYSNYFVRSDGTYINTTSPEWSKLLGYMEPCGFSLAMALANGSIDSPQQLVSQKTQCLQWWVDRDGLKLTVKLVGPY